MKDLNEITEILKENKLLDGRAKLSGRYDNKIKEAVAKYQEQLPDYKHNIDGNWGTYTEIAHNKKISNEKKDLPHINLDEDIEKED